MRWGHTPWRGLGPGILWMGMLGCLPVAFLQERYAMVALIIIIGFFPFCAWVKIWSGRR